MDDSKIIELYWQPKTSYRFLDFIVCIKARIIAGTHPISSNSGIQQR